jgi:hypothetical protein
VDQLRTMQVMSTSRTDPYHIHHRKMNGDTGKRQLAPPSMAFDLCRRALTLHPCISGRLFDWFSIRLLSTSIDRTIASESLLRSEGKRTRIPKVVNYVRPYPALKQSQCMPVILHIARPSLPATEILCFLRMTSRSPSKRVHTLVFFLCS